MPFNNKRLQDNLQGVIMSTEAVVEQIGEIGDLAQTIYNMNNTLNNINNTINNMNNTINTMNNNLNTLINKVTNDSSKNH